MALWPSKHVFSKKQVEGLLRFFFGGVILNIKINTLKSRQSLVGPFIWLWNQNKNLVQERARKKIPL